MEGTFGERSEEIQIRQLTELAGEFLSEYDLIISGLEIINHGYNSTLAVSTLDDQRFALRINVNSPRSISNLRAELAWREALRIDGSISLPRPVVNASGGFIGSRFSEALGKDTSAVMFSWLPGTEVAKLEDQHDPVLASGRLLAELHDLGRDFVVPDDAALPLLDDVLWGFDNHLVGPKSRVEDRDQDLFASAFAKISDVLTRLYRNSRPHVIHADVHGGNLMWNNAALSVFDFDDSGIGLPLQDIGVSLFYLRDSNHRSLLLEGYEQIAELPPHDEGDLDSLVLQRRLHLLNYILETQNPEHRGLLDDYLVATREEVKMFLSN